jgi:neutral ceramidase
MIRAGASVVDITPPAGLAMSGFAARVPPASGAHDLLTVRALVIGDTAIAVADVIGIDAALSYRVRMASGLPPEKVTLAATHTHGGPVSMTGRLAGEADPAFLECLETAFVTALRRAAEAREPVTLFGGTGVEPGVARNRRHRDGPVDTGVPVLRLDRDDGSVLAVLVSYACHPVVLSSDNLLWTADFPHFVRAMLEQALPGAVAIFATGCAGDVNTGHSAAASLDPTSHPLRSYAEAERIGRAIAASALAAPLRPLGDAVSAAEAFAELAFAPEDDLPARIEAWQAERETAVQSRARILDIWSDWGARLANQNASPLRARVSAANWGDARMLAMPGEIFAGTALDLRRAMGADRTGPLFILGYADDNPGYIPPEGEFAFGGYEVTEAHRFYGLPAGLAPHSAEKLATAVLKASGGQHRDNHSQGDCYD